MKNTKKVLSVALAGALAFGCAGAAFGAAPEMDKDTDKKVVEAVERLSAFGIVNGMEDGKYHEEMMVTRAQFAKILVEALGLGGVVGQSTTSFADVDANHWASGYIAVATGQGLIKGYADGTFKPEKEVSYAEAVTMLVRALGYKDEFLQGTWPSNYIGKAAEEDITDGVRVSNGSADRGAVALMVDNTLDAETVTQETFGDDNNFKKSKKTLLEEKLEIDLKEEVKISDTPQTNDSLDANEVKVVIGRDEDGDDIKETYEVVEGIDTANLLGLEADLYINDDDEIVYVDVTTDEDEKITGVITAVNTSDKEITVQFADGEDEDYELNLDDDKDIDVDVYINNEEKDFEKDIVDVLDSSSNNDEFFGTVVLNDKEEVETLNVFKFDTDKAVIVKEINEDKKYIKGLSGTSEETKVDFDEEDGYRIFLDGKEIKFEDVKEGDMVYGLETVLDVDGDEYTYVFVVRNSFEGKLEKLRSDEIVVAGEEYDVNAKFTYSTDKDDEAKNDYSGSELEDAVGENVTAYLDIKGELRHISSDAKETSDTMYGIVTDYDKSSSDEIKEITILTAEDEEVSYKFDDTDDLTTDEENISTGIFVEYELNKDGEIDAEAYDVITDAKVTIAEFDDEDDYIKVGSKKYYVDEDTVLMDAVEEEVVDWDAIKDSDVATKNVKAVIIADEDEVDAEFVVFTDNYDTISADATLAYVKGDIYYDGDYKVDVELADGSEKTYEVKDSQREKAFEGDFVLFTTNDGEINDVVRAVYDDKFGAKVDVDKMEEEYEVYAGEATKFENNKLVVKISDSKTESFKLNDDVAVYTLTLDDNEYDEVDKGDLSDIDEGSVVRVIENDGDVEMVVVVED